MRASLDAQAPARTRGARPAAPAVLGLDLGSTGSKAALLDAATGAVLANVYRRTDGNPVEAAKALVAEIREMARQPCGCRRHHRFRPRRGGDCLPRGVSRSSARVSTWRTRS